MEVDPPAEPGAAIHRRQNQWRLNADKAETTALRPAGRQGARGVGDLQRGDASAWSISPRGTVLRVPRVWGPRASPGPKAPPRFAARLKCLSVKTLSQNVAALRR